MSSALWQTDLPGLPAPKRGKVRDIYDLGEHLLLVACDRISAYDHVLRPAIPDKGKILNQITNYWFDELSDVVPNHIAATDPGNVPSELRPHADQLRGRAALVRKADVIPFECVARGYLAGSAFRAYRSSGSICGIDLPEGLERASRLPEPIFTPATKAETGHDENVTAATMAKAVGPELTETLREWTLALYRRGAEHVEDRDLILADTKFEFGRIEGELVLIDEVLTPDSSRYWDREAWEPGVEPASFDKQFVRNWLDSSGWDHESTPPKLPDEVVQGTRNRYLEAFRRITGTEPVL
ncbi:MAG: phosphoribosylaminoimidazolesuccinocarboxamide synthase [Thermoanaerobaculia bacterium]|nr:phosphoribosylaminoimidazolesuccinocarboxamide synthase [Thermoanaerobaculia bacterium]